MTGPIRIVVADDHPLFRAGLRALLESVPDTDVVGEAATGDEAVHAALSLQPDIVVMDINMPGLNGIDATRQIIDSCSDVHVLVMTMHDDDDDAVFAAIRAGARGYLLKGAAQDETLRAIRSVANGEAIFGPKIAADLQRFLATQPRSEPGQAFPQLTDRELEILQLLAQRRSNAQIAAELYLSQKTVRNYVSAIFAKLQVADRAEAGLVARAGRTRKPRRRPTPQLLARQSILFGEQITWLPPSRTPTTSYRAHARGRARAARRRYPPPSRRS